MFSLIEHVQDVNRILIYIGAYSSIILGKKLQLGKLVGKIISHKYTFNGQVPEDQKVQKIKDWLACTMVMEMQEFLGTSGVLRIFIKRYLIIT